MAPRHRTPDGIRDGILADVSIPERTSARTPDGTSPGVRTPDLLIVDAHDGIRATLRYVLQDAGYRVYAAGTARQALVHRRTHPSGLVILLDVSLPCLPRLYDMVLLNRILSGASPPTRHAFVLLSTNPDYTLGLALGLVLACGVPVVPKPFDLDDILDAVTVATRRLSASMPALASVGMRAHPDRGEA
jgi:CheY-like chemotaxis protein